MTSNEKAVLEAVHQWFPDGLVDNGWVAELDNAPGCNPAVVADTWRFESSPTHRPGAVAEPSANEAGSVPNTAPETIQEELF